MAFCLRIPHFLYSYNFKHANNHLEKKELPEESVQMPLGDNQVLPYRSCYCEMAGLQWSVSKAHVHGFKDPYEDSIMYTCTP